jgi:hypothetical protein
MTRFLNFLALIAVIASATWAYSVKYETILVAEKLKKRETELRRERDAIQVLSAEWELLNRPARLAALAKPEAGMQQLSARQVVNARDIPAAQPAKGDMLDSLLTGSLPSVPKAETKTAPVAAVPKGTAKAPPKAAKKTPLKAPGDKPDAKVVAVPNTQKSGAPKAAPLALAPKANAPKTAASKAANPPKANAPVRLTPPAPVAASAPRRDEGGLNSLFKKILN